MSSERHALRILDGLRSPECTCGFKGRKNDVLDHIAEENEEQTTESVYS